MFASLSLVVVVVVVFAFVMDVCDAGMNKTFRNHHLHPRCKRHGHPARKAKRRSAYPLTHSRFSLFFRYFCPSRLGGGVYPKWEPRAITEGACKRRRSRAEMMAAGASPFPPGFKVLFYGNSYMRQVKA